MSTWYENFDELLTFLKNRRSTVPVPLGTAASWPYDTIQYRIEGEIAYVKIADMRTSNGLTNKTTLALMDVCFELYDRPDVKVVVYTAGGKYFCTGGAFAANDPADAKYGPQSAAGADEYEKAIGGNMNVGSLVALTINLPQFKIASIRGENMGAGNSLISSMDYVVAPRNNCSLHFMEVRRGVSSCATWQGVLSKMGTGARQYTMIGEEVLAEEGAKVGLIDILMDDRDSSDTYAKTKAMEIAALPVEQIRPLKKTGHFAKIPLLQMPPAIMDLDAMQLDTPIFSDVVKEAIEATGKTGRIAEARLSKKMWPHQSVKFEKKGQQMMVITLANPESNNAITAEMLDGLLDAAVELHKSVGKVRLVEIRASGEFFCSGLDKNSDLDSEQLQRLIFLYYMLPMPTVGIIEGKVAGFGNVLCSAFDQVLASTTSAKFDFTGVKSEKYSEFLKDKMGLTQFEKTLAEADKTYSAEEMKKSKLVTKLFADQSECAGLLEAICNLVTQAAPNGVADQKTFIARCCTQAMTPSSLEELAAHVAKRTAYDMEFVEAIKGLMDKSYSPMYTRAQVSAAPASQIVDPEDLI